MRAMFVAVRCALGELDEPMGSIQTFRLQRSGMASAAVRGRACVLRLYAVSAQSPHPE